MKKNRKAKNFSLLLVLVCMGVMSIAAETQAASVFPFAVGYTATYSASQGSTNWTCTLQVTGTQEINFAQWMITQLENWDGDSSIKTMDFSCTATAMSVYGTKNGSSYTYPVFKESPVNSTWSYKNNHGNAETAKIVSIGQLTVPAGTFNNVYQVRYSAIDHDEDMYWLPGVGLIKDVDNNPSSGSGSGPFPPVTRELMSNPVQDVLLGTWSGSMTIIYPPPKKPPIVETGNVQVIFNSTGNTDAYTGTLYWTSSYGTLGPLNITAIKGPFDLNSVHITSAGYVILGQLRLITTTATSYWVLDLQGSDTSTGNTLASLGLTME